jgi:hypothetical protein
MADAVNESWIKLEPCRCGSNNIDIMDGTTIGRRLWYAKCLNCGKKGRRLDQGVMTPKISGMRNSENGERH